MLGEAFHEQFQGSRELKCTDIDVNEDWLSYLDVRDLEAYRKDVREFGAEALFHLAAFTDLEYCERNPDETYRTNTTPVENAVYIANELDIPILYISSAGIYDGNKDSYDDWDPPRPLGVYARTKYLGERFVVENAHRYLVCRAGWMMGAGPRKDKKFVQKIMAQIKAGERTLHIVDDKNGTPTYTHDFARNVKLLLENRLWGLYNVVCGGQTSRLDVAREILRILGRQDEIAIVPVGSDYFKEEYFAARPASERLVNRKLDLRGMNIMRDWRVALKEYLERYYGDFFLV